MIGRRAGLIILSVALAAGTARAQDTGTGRTPQPRPRRAPGDDDQKLDDSLRREFETPSNEIPEGERPPPPPPLREREVEEPPPPPPRDRDRDKEKDELGLRLGALAGHWSAGVFNVRVASRKSDLGSGSAFQLEDSTRLDLQRSETQLYRGWLRYGGVGLRFGFTSTLYRENGSVGNPFDFAGVQWNSETPVTVRFETYIVDVDGTFRPVATPFFDLDAILGIRYVWGSTQIKDRAGLGIDVGQSQNNFMPMVGLEGTIKAIPDLLSFYLRLQGGGFGYRTTGSSGARDRFPPFPAPSGPSTFVGPTPSSQGPHFRENNFFSYEVELGCRLLYEDHIGFVFGYRLDTVGMLYETNSNRSRMEYAHEGPFIAFVAQY
jgi:hypothetical protein